MPGIPNVRGSEGGKAANAPATGSFDWNPISWWNSWFDSVTNWIGGLGGDIASGIEGGFVAILKDLWTVVLPFIEIGIGTVIAMFSISVWLLSSDGGKSLLGSALMVAPK